MRAISEIINVLVMFVMGCLWVVIYCSAIPAYGWSGAFLWTLLFAGPMIIAFCLIRFFGGPFSGFLNAIIFVTLSFQLSPAGKMSVAQQLKSYDKIAEFTKQDHEAHVVMGGYRDSGEASAAPIAERAQYLESKLEHSWSTYYYINPEDPKRQRFDQKHFFDHWVEFQNWFQTHKYPEDGRPPMPHYFGSDEDIRHADEKDIDITPKGALTTDDKIDAINARFNYILKLYEKRAEIDPWINHHPDPMELYDKLGTTIDEKYDAMKKGGLDIPKSWNIPMEWRRIDEP